MNVDRRAPAARRSPPPARPRSPRGHRRRARSEGRRRPTRWACSTTPRSASAARPASSRAARRTTRSPTRRTRPAGLWDTPLDLERAARRTSSSSTRAGRTRALVLQGAVHALRRPGLHDRLHARRAARRREHGIVSLRPEPTASAAATARWPARSTSRSSSGTKAAPKIVKCELCRHRVQDAALADDGGFSRYPKGHGPACARSARARR